MSYSNKIVTIQRHIIEGENAHPQATGELSTILRELTLAFKLIYREVGKAGLVNIIGLAGRDNIHGEQVKKLDVFADEKIFQAMDHIGKLCVMASEEHENVLEIPDTYSAGKYVLIYDPLDGSSNIDVCVSIGSIFSIYRRVSTSGKGSLTDCLQPGYKQVAAGYVIYGSSTMLVYTTGDGVYGFTLDPSIGEFLLSHQNIKIPKQGKIFSINEGNYERWTGGMRRYINYLKGENENTGGPYSARYTGSMVADIHRTLLYGGIFLYPEDNKQPEGKLRLMYECNPLAFIIEQAGGKAINGKERILDLIPKSLHQKTSFIAGSINDVLTCEEFLRVEK